MAISQNPLTGQMSGTVGNFVTSSLGSKNIVRAKSFSYRDAKTTAQLMQREGLKMIGKLFPMLGSIPEEGFAQRDSESSVYAAFMAANLSGAIDKSGEVAAIDYSKLKLAVGTLSEPTVNSATLIDGVVSIEYKPKLGNRVNLPTDELVALVLTNSGELWESRQVRGDLAVATIAIPVEDAVAADVLGVYLFAKRADGSKVSDSVFVPLV